MTATRSRRGRWVPQKGFALPVVLLVLAAMAVIALRLVDRARTDIAVAQAHRNEIVARQAADGGIATFIALYPQMQNPAVPVETVFGTARVTVVAENEAGKIDLNAGALPLIGGLLRVAGVEDAQADQLVGQLAELRGREDGWILHSPDELLRLPGVDFALMERLRPYVTIFNLVPGIDPRVAPREVLLSVPDITPEVADRIIAARDAGGRLSREDRAALRRYRGRGGAIYRIVATATLEQGASFIREATADLSNPSEPLMLSWRRVFPAGPPPDGNAE